MTDKMPPGLKYMLRLYLLLLYRELTSNLLCYFDFCLCNLKLDVSSQEFLCYDGGVAHVGKGFINILNSRVWKTAK